jgi:hypothetical protein
LKVSVLPRDSLCPIDLNFIRHNDMLWTYTPNLLRVYTKLENGIVIFNWEQTNHCICAMLMAVFWHKLELVVFFCNSAESSMLDDPPLRDHDVWNILHWPNFEGFFGIMGFIPQSNGEGILQPTPSTLSPLKFSTILGSVQVTNGTPCDSAHCFDIIGVLYPVSKRTLTGMIFLSWKLANMHTVSLEPVFGSGGSCFVFLDSGWGVLAAALCFQSFQVETIMNCLSIQLRLQ